MISFHLVTQNTEKFHKLGSIILKSNANKVYFYYFSSVVLESLTSYIIPLEGLHGRVLPHVDLQVGTGSKHDFLASCSLSKSHSWALPQGQQEMSEGFRRHSVQTPAWQISWQKWLPQSRALQYYCWRLKLALLKKLMTIKNNLNIFDLDFHVFMEVRVR